ncbi:MAG: hypothetical protein ACOX4P_07100 [Anaerovoracaceae bacterium]|jgi:hypothetical protein
MDVTNKDLGDMKSRDIGNLISKKLVDYGKEAVQDGNPTDEVDLGDLPSRALTDLGKQALLNKLDLESK